MVLLLEDVEGFIFDDASVTTGGGIPAYVCKGAEVGHAVFWPQEGWLRLLGVPAGRLRDFKKSQRRNGTLEDVVRCAGLGEEVSHYHEDGGPQTKTQVRGVSWSSEFLFHFLGYVLGHGNRFAGQGSTMPAHAGVVLRKLVRVASRGFTDGVRVPLPLPGRGLLFTLMPDGTTPQLSEYCAMLPGFIGMWTAIREDSRQGAPAPDPFTSATFADFTQVVCSLPFQTIAAYKKSGLSP